MTDYTPEQLEHIRLAVGAGREAMRLAGRFEPLVFARAFTAAGGVQMPGKPGDAQSLAARLIHALDRGEVSTDPLLTREIERARSEARWAALAEADDVVGFRMDLPPAAVLEPICRELMKADHGLGAAVFRKAEIVVLPAVCGNARFTPVYDHEIEQ